MSNSEPNICAYSTLHQSSKRSPPTTSKLRILKIRPHLSRNRLLKVEAEIEEDLIIWRRRLIFLLNCVKDERVIDQWAVNILDKFLIPTVDIRIILEPFLKEMAKMSSYPDRRNESHERVHLVLAKLGIVHFLCLGGLWGQVRIGRALPWARKVELCLVDTLRDDVLITKAFREVGLSATYLHAAGVYRIQEHEVGEDAPKVEVVVFEKDAVVSLITKLTQMVRRVGWTRRVLPPDCEFSPSLQCFPPQLVIPPLPAKQFGGRLIPVPREGIELQKYHYPNDWWLEVKPTDCAEPQETSA
ncbi:hypothetical protein WN51_12079 [Melipona quadrifasciata]|uniref:Uncharacterized protein n=1 Tax=Melipona quadrifasciata TaxID=166423 RepID=A0A0N1ITQ7_9HYME|nr:hypothetical protein WN51_12079 [Melipona quadrifasciata]